MAKVLKNPPSDPAPEEAQGTSSELAHDLVVTEAFGSHRVGDVISDPAEAAVVTQKYPGHFTKVAKSV